MTISAFDRGNVAAIRQEINAALFEVAKRNGIKIDLGTIRFSGKEMRVKLTANTFGQTPAAPQTNANFIRMMDAFGLVAHQSVNGKTLVDYQSRNRKYPFIYADEITGKRFKCSLAQAEFYFGKGKK